MSPPGDSRFQFESHCSPGDSSLQFESHCCELFSLRWGKEGEKLGECPGRSEPCLAATLACGGNLQRTQWGLCFFPLCAPCPTSLLPQKRFEVLQDLPQSPSPAFPTTSLLRVPSFRAGTEWEKEDGTYTFRQVTMKQHYIIKKGLASRAPTWYFKTQQDPQLVNVCEALRTAPGS